jgi:predicted exporter
VDDLLADMNQEKQRTTIGTAVLVVSTLLILAIVQSSAVPVLLGSLAAVGMVLGSVLIGTATQGV